MQQAEPKREREEEENQLNKKAPKFAKPAFQQPGNFKGIHTITLLHPYLSFTIMSSSYL